MPIDDACCIYAMVFTPANIHYNTQVLKMLATVNLHGYRRLQALPDHRDDLFPRGKHVQDKISSRGARCKRQI